MKTLYKQLIFVALGIAILVVGGLVIYGATAGGGLKVNPILGHDLDLDALYYAQAGNNTVHDITTQDISISAWVKVDVDAGASFVITKTLSGQSGYYLYVRGTTGKIEAYIRDISATNVYQLTGTTNIKDNKWHYISAIFDRDAAANCKIFLDGVENGTTVKSGTVTNVGSISSAAILTLGWSSNILDGQIRDVKLYYAAGDHWSDAQVLYQAQHPFDYTANAGTLTDYWRLDEGTGTTLYGKVNNLTLSNVLAWTTQPKIKMVKQENTTTTGNNPVGWWKMDEGTASSSYDSSGNGNTGTLTGGVQWATGKLGKGLSFDGVNDYVSVGSFSKYSSFTISVWVKGNSYTQNTYSGIVWAGDGNTAYGLGINGNNVYSRISTGNPSGQDNWTMESYDSINYPTGWHLMTIVNNGTTRFYYKDGVFNSQHTNTVTNSGTAQQMSIGRWGSYIGSDAYFNGSLDDVRLYNRALSAGEVAQMYNSTKDGYLGKIKVSTGLVGYWKLDDNNALTSVIDYSGKGNTGTAYSGTATSTSVLSTSTAMVGRAMSFDGVDDYVSVGNLQTFNLSSYTVSLWFKTGTASTIELYTDGGTDNSYGEFYISSGRVGADFGGGAGGTFNLLTDDAYNNNVWHQAVLVQSSKSSRNIYIDGVLKKSDTSAITSNIFNYSSIGALKRASVLYYCNGLIDEVKIWNYARSAEQIGQDYVRGLKGLP